MGKPGQKQGGNGFVTFEGDVATKTLKSHPTRERLDRFSQEIEALWRARNAGVENVIEILDADLASKPPRFTMRRCTGDLEDLLALTRNQPRLVAKLILPVVVALRHLALLPQPIYHRDVKPQNILYNGSKNEPTLVLSDFGCAFLGETEADRLTADFRAVGATFFRAPEYTHGRVENVNSAGDIFSIGKVLWYLCNGVQDEVFPYTLWFPDEYSLSRRCAAAGVERLNLIIAGCVVHDPVKRISYDALIRSLTELTEQTMSMPNDAERTRIAAYEAQLQVEHEESKARFVELHACVKADLAWAAEALGQAYAGTNLVSSVQDLTNFISGDAESLARVLIDACSDSPVSDWQSRHARFHVRAYPSTYANRRGLPNVPVPFFSINAIVNHRDGEMGYSASIYIRGEAGVRLKIENAEDVQYSRDGLLSFFLKVIARIGV